MSYGILPYGSSSYGQSVQGSSTDFLKLPTGNPWDIARIGLSSIDQLLLFSESFFLGNPNDIITAPQKLQMCSKVESYSELNAVGFTLGFSDTYTAEWEFSVDNLPGDVNEIENTFLAFGIQNIGGTQVTIFITHRQGIFYTGYTDVTQGVLSVDRDDLILIPDSVGLIKFGIRYVLRIISDSSRGQVYIYVTPSDSLSTSGYNLIAVLPQITSLDISGQDISFVALSGGTEDVCITLYRYFLSNQSLFTNIIPVANPGPDKQDVLCNLVRFDGSTSFDPEGRTLSYEWRLIDAPSSSRYVEFGSDAYTSELAGVTNIVNIPSLAVIHQLDPIVVGDVLQISNKALSIIKVNDTNPFSLTLESAQVPDSLSNAGYKLIRQRGFINTDQVKPTLYPDVTGFYVADLLVDDGEILSDPTLTSRPTTTLTVTDQVLPYGVIPDMRFVFQNLLDFWNLVDDKGTIEALWSGMLQVLSSELYTLWQYDYCKSLNDIPRQVVKQWLHYDLKLAEPVQDLTEVEYLYGPIDSIPVGPVFNVVQDSTITFKEDINHFSIQLTRGGIQELSSVAQQIQVSLKERYLDVTASIYTVGSEYFIRVQASVFLEVEEDSTGLFLKGESTGLFSGQADLVSDRVIRVDTTLLGYSFRENRLIIINGKGYSLQSIQDDPLGTYRYQLIIVKEKIELSTSYTWSIPSVCKSAFLNFYKGLVVEGDYLYLLSDEFLHRTRILGSSETQQQLLGFELTSSSNRNKQGTHIAYIVRASYLPIHKDIEKVPLLQLYTVIRDKYSEVLRENIDYFIEEFRGQHCLRFDTRVWEQEEPSHRLWSEYTYFSNDAAIENNFGKAVGLTREQLSGGIDYLAAVRGLWYVYSRGASIKNIRVGTQILLGLPFAESGGVITEIREAFLSSRSRILITSNTQDTVVKAYTFNSRLSLEINPATNEPYKVGDTVSKFAPLVKGVEIVDYVKDPKWFQGLIRQGSFTEAEKYHSFLVKVESNAFNLNALLFSQVFIERIDPSYTTPYYYVSLLLPEDADFNDITLSDTIIFNGTLSLYASVCSLKPTIWDVVDSNGGYENSFDTESSTETQWGFDKDIACPEDNLEVYQVVEYQNQIPTFDTGLKFDRRLENLSYITVGSVSTLQETTTLFTASNTNVILNKIIIKILSDDTEFKDYTFKIGNIFPLEKQISVKIGPNFILEWEINLVIPFVTTIDFLVLGSPGPVQWKSVTAEVVGSSDLTWSFDDGPITGSFFVKTLLSGKDQAK